MQIFFHIIPYSILLFAFGRTIEVNSNCCFPHILNYYPNIICTDEQIFCSNCTQEESKIGQSICMNNCNITTLMFNFTQFRYITSLELKDNYIESVSDDSFRELTELRSLMLYCNYISSLDENAFADLKSLKYLDLSNNKLSHLPKNVFRRLINLQIFSISNNELLDIPNDLFGSNRNLSDIRIQNNKGLKFLPPLLFSNFPMLESVDVSNCSLHYLPANLFENSTKLQEINLAQNKLSQLTGLFDNLRLRKLDLSYNKFALSEVTKLCQLSDYLTDLNLSYNRIDEFFYCSRYIQQLHKLNLSGNNITYVNITQYFLSLIYKVSVNLENNRITTVDLPSDIGFVGKHLTLKLKLNPLICNCRNYQLCLHLYKKRNAIEIRGLDATVLTKLKGNKLQYSQATNCPEFCTCHYFCPKREYVVDCSNNSLTSYPDLQNAFGEFDYDFSVVKLSTNLLTKGPPIMKGYENVSQLDLAHNSIKNLDWLPDSLKMLNLAGNNMTWIATDIIATMDGMNVLLHDNPWNCVCNMSSFIKFVKETNIKNKDKIICDQNNTRVILLKISDICSPQSNYYYMTILLVILPFTFILIIIYLKYKKRMDGCISDNNLDYELTYDAFISYSHEDENFVLKELVPKLENASNPYKLCIHQRDWLAGDWIVEQVTRSVEDSRKTIIVLSPSFLGSDWGKLEFNTAYSLTLKEGSNRIIVILYKDVDMNSNIDKEIFEYLQKKTYIKWGDRWFWDNLEHALTRN